MLPPLLFHYLHKLLRKMQNSWDSLQSLSNLLDVWTTLSFNQGPKSLTSQAYQYSQLLTLSFLVHAKRSRQIFSSAYLSKMCFLLLFLLTYRKLYVFNGYSLMSLKINIHHETDITTVYTITISPLQAFSCPLVITILCVW